MIEIDIFVVFWMLRWPWLLNVLLSFMQQTVLFCFLLSLKQWELFFPHLNWNPAHTTRIKAGDYTYKSNYCPKVMFILPENLNKGPEQKMRSIFNNKATESLLIEFMFMLWKHILSSRIKKQYILWNIYRVSEEMERWCCLFNRIRSRAALQKISLDYHWDSEREG